MVPRSAAAKVVANSSRWNTGWFIRASTLERSIGAVRRESAELQRQLRRFPSCQKPSRVGKRTLTATALPDDGATLRHWGPCSLRAYCRFAHEPHSRGWIPTREIGNRDLGIIAGSHRLAEAKYCRRSVAGCFSWQSHGRDDFRCEGCESCGWHLPRYGSQLASVASAERTKNFG